MWAVSNSDPRRAGLRQRFERRERMDQVDQHRRRDQRLSLLESVGAYALAAAIQEGAEDNVSAQTDTVPLEIDGLCCYNFRRK